MGHDRPIRTNGRPGDKQAIIAHGFDMCRAAGAPDPSIEDAVQAALFEAAPILERLPDPDRRYRFGFHCTPWHRIDPDIADEPDIDIDLTTAAAIGRAEGALSWFGLVGCGRRRRRGLSDDERRRRAAKIVWLRSRGLSYAAIGRRFGIHRSTAMRIFRQGIGEIAVAVEFEMQEEGRLRTG